MSSAFQRCYIKNALHVINYDVDENCKNLNGTFRMVQCSSHYRVM